MHNPAAVSCEGRLGSPEDILRRAGSVPEYTTFPPVDELVARFEQLESENPELVTSRRVGTSQLGEPIRMYSIGTGGLSNLVVGGVHPNEPIGARTATYLLEQLIADPDLRGAFDATWHIIPCVDPDGARLNEGWFANPGDRGQYGRRFYRPAPNQQVEWTFPFDYKKAYFDEVLPETQGLMRAIDLTKPSLYVALHNGEIGGVYYYLTSEAPELYGMLHEIPASLGLPLDRGEPEGPHFTELAPAIFDAGALEDVYDYMEGLGLDPFPPGSGGDASSSYAKKYNTFSLIAELPYWKHPAADDLSEIEESYSDLLRRTGEQLVELGEVLCGLLERAEPYFGRVTPHLRSTRSFAPMMVSSGQSNLARSVLEASQRPATVAERFSCEDLVHMYRLRFGGMLLRALEAETVAGTATAELRRIAAETEAQYEQWQLAAAAFDETEVIPISALVGVQYGATLAAAAHLARASE